MLVHEEYTNYISQELCFLFPLFPFCSYLQKDDIVLELFAR